MNPLIPLVTAGSLFAPIQPIPMQTIYVANLSATDGRDAGAYYTIYPQPQVPEYRITPCVIVPEDKEGE